MVDFFIKRRVEVILLSFKKGIIILCLNELTRIFKAQESLFLLKKIGRPITKA